MIDFKQLSAGRKDLVTLHRCSGQVALESPISQAVDGEFNPNSLRKHEELPIDWFHCPSPPRLMYVFARKLYQMINRPHTAKKVSRNISYHFDNETPLRFAIKYYTSANSPGPHHLKHFAFFELDSSNTDPNPHSTILPLASMLLL